MLSLYHFERIELIEIITDYKPEDAELLALEVLPCYNQPLALAVNRAAWLRLVRYLGLRPEKLVDKHLAQLRDVYIDGFSPTEVRERSLY